MSDTDEPDFSGLERVEKQVKTLDSPDNPKVSVQQDGEIVYFLKHARQVLGQPNYVAFYKSSTKVFIEPHENTQGVLNPHKIHSSNYNAITSFGWHQCEETGYAPLKYDDERNAYYFDTAELEDD